MICLLLYCSEQIIIFAIGHTLNEDLDGVAYLFVPLPQEEEVYCWAPSLLDDILVVLGGENGICVEELPILVCLQ